MNNSICWVCGSNIPDTVIEKLGTPIAELGLSKRALNCLRRAEIETVEELVKFPHKDLLRIRHMGIVTVEEIIIKVKWFGFDWE